MKYDSEQKTKVIKKGRSLHREEVKKYEVLKEKYPVEVDIVGGFYIIESKLNNQ